MIFVGLSHLLSSADALVLLTRQPQAPDLVVSFKLQSKLLQGVAISGIIGDYYRGY